MVLKMEHEIKIVRNAEERKKEIKAISDQITRGIVIPNKRTLIVTPDLFAKIFSPKRIELLMLLAIKNDYNITELAKKLKRPFEVVHRDLKLFEFYGFVRMVKERKSIIPELAGEIRMPVIS